MTNLETRVARLESAQSKANLKSMTDDELSARISTLPFRSKEGFVAIFELIGRHPSAFPVVHEDPSQKSISGNSDW